MLLHTTHDSHYMFGKFDKSDLIKGDIATVVTSGSPNDSIVIKATANENHLGKILERAVFFPRYLQDVVVVKVCPNS